MIPERDRPRVVDFHNEVVLPALMQRLDQAFPEFGWHRDPHGWVATNQHHTHARLGVRAQRVRLDRTREQDVSVYLGVEKRGIVAQLEAWFSDLGLPVLSLGGYASQSFVDKVAADVEAQDRPAVLLYAGDYDPSGEDIDRDFIARAGCFDEVVRVALSAEQIVEHGLPPQPGKATDSRAAAFVAKHGTLVQVELDALPPDVLRDLYRQALAPSWDVSAYEAVLAEERAERDTL